MYRAEARAEREAAVRDPQKIENARIWITRLASATGHDPFETALSHIVRLEMYIDQLDRMMSA